MSNEKDIEILKIVRGFTRGMTNGDVASMCYAVSVPLAAYLGFCGFRCQVVKGKVEGNEFEWGHYWLKLPDGRIIDPTAAQLNIDSAIALPEIYFGEIPPFYKEIKIKSL